MKRVFVLLVSLLAILAARTSIKAQEITITLSPGWNWISYPNAVTMEINEALGSFVPVQGDLLKAKKGSSATFNGTSWRGSLTHFTPGFGYMYYSARSEATSFVFANASSTVVETATPTDITTTSAVVGGTVTVPEGGHVFLRGVCWGTEPNPDIDGDHTAEGTGMGSFGSTLIGLNPNTTYYIRAYAVSDHGLVYGNEQSFTTEAQGGTHEYVDLCLPSGTLWATCNVGANTPEEYGDYFAWGETQPKDTYNWSTYQYANGTSGFDPQLTKYCTNADYGYNGFTDNLTTLLPEDDAATADWGSDWRMPTKEDWQELLDHTSHTCTNYNGVNGWLFTASNGNTLFLAAAGSRYDGDLYDDGVGNYWSSSLTIDAQSGNYISKCSWLLICYTNNNINNELHMGYAGMRESGCSVRAVRSSAQSNAPMGAINGKFTINANGDQVYFSQGNLQYIGSASTPYWKFADNQWDYLGITTNQNSTNQNVDRDLFCWGTSGYNHGAVCYQPWSTSQTYSDYYAYGQFTYNLYDQTGQADWGYNAISNGGNTTNTWRTLTGGSNGEWKYIFDSRSTPSGIRYAMAQVNGVNGVILLPDDWSASYYSLSNTNQGGASYSSNVISSTQWSTLEQYGAVFLPAAGYRDGTSLYDAGTDGNYWSASYGDNYYAYSVYFYDTYLLTGDNDGRYYGQSVRLVRPAEN